MINEIFIIMSVLTISAFHQIQAAQPQDLPLFTEEEALAKVDHLKKEIKKIPKNSAIFTKVGEKRVNFEVKFFLNHLKEQIKKQAQANPADKNPRKISFDEKLLNNSLREFPSQKFGHPTRKDYFNFTMFFVNIIAYTLLIEYTILKIKKFIYPKREGNITLYPLPLLGGVVVALAVTLINQINIVSDTAEGRFRQLYTRNLMKQRINSSI